MKKLIKFLPVIILTISLVAAPACSDDDNKPDTGQNGNGNGNGDGDGNGNGNGNGNGGEEGEVIDLGDGSDLFEISSDMTLFAKNTYVLKGFVYVTEGNTLTIEPGTVIKGDKASKGTLIVERGAKINAQGTEQKPIVFTSGQDAGKRNPGDWGGIIICGKAPNNMGEMTIEGGVRSKHGGTDPSDNSGVLSYVRCEFAGVEYSTDNEINGITFGSVGTGTKVDHLQVSYSGDDSFEWFGGTVNASHLVSLAAWDDDFDTDNGFSGKIQFAYSLRHPQIGDKSASNGFESDNNGTGADTDPHTACVFANVTLMGPVNDPSNYVDQSGDYGSPSDAKFQAALHLRRNTNLSVFNSVIAGFPIGLIIENDKGSVTQDHATAGRLNVTNCVMAGMVKNYQDAQYWSNESVYNPEDEGSFAANYFTRNGGGNSVYETIADLGFTANAQDLKSVGAIPSSSSVLANGAEWSNTLVSSGFEKVTYLGAFGPTETQGNNWTTGWCNFDPQNTIY